MLYLALMTLLLLASPLEREVDQTVEEYLSQIDMAATQYAVVVSPYESQGAAVMYWVEDGKDLAIFFFDRELLLELSEQERRVLIAHEVGHLAPECQLDGYRIFRELCADRVAAQLVSQEDVAAMLAKSILMFPFYPARQEFVFRFAMIQEERHVEAIEPTVPPLASLLSQVAWIDCD